MVSPLIPLTETDPSGRLLSQGPKFPLLSPFLLFIWNAVSPSLSPRLSLFRSSLLRLLLHRVNTPIRTRGPTCARTHRPRVVSFGPLLPRQLATARPPHGQEYRVSEYHRDHPFERRVSQGARGSAGCNERISLVPEKESRDVGCVTAREAPKDRS